MSYFKIFDLTANNSLCLIKFNLSLINFLHINTKIILLELIISIEHFEMYFFLLLNNSTIISLLIFIKLVETMLDFDLTLVNFSTKDLF